MWYEVLRYRMQGNGTYSAARYIAIYPPPLNTPSRPQVQAPNVSPLSSTGPMDNLLSIPMGPCPLLLSLMASSESKNPAPQIPTLQRITISRRCTSLGRFSSTPWMDLNSTCSRLMGRPNRRCVYFPKHQTCCPPNYSGTPPMRQPPF